MRAKPDPFDVLRGQEHDIFGDGDNAAWRAALAARLREIRTGHTSVDPFSRAPSSTDSSGSRTDSDPEVMCMCGGRPVGLRRASACQGPCE
jgi:hypothetical protein